MCYSKIMFVILFGFITASSHSNDVSYKYETNANLKHINDGDTASISIRFYGIDTPEKTQSCMNSKGHCYPCGQASTQALIDLIENKNVTIKFTGDVTYGRPVASIFKEGRDLNLEMVKQGHAVAYLTYLDGEMKKKYKAAQEEAKEQKLGIWQGEFIEPFKWRRGNRLTCEK